MNKYYIQYSNDPTNEASWTNFKGLNSKLECYKELLAHLQAPRILSSLDWTSGFRWGVKTGEKTCVYRIYSTLTQQDVKYSVTEYRALCKKHNMNVRLDC